MTSTTFADIGAILSSIKESPHGPLGLIISSALFCSAIIWLKKDSKNIKSNKNTARKVGNSHNSTAEKAVANAPKVESPDDVNDGNNGYQPPKSKPNINKSKGGNGNELRNVFSVKQKPIATGNGSSSNNKQSKSSSSSDEKPFESSYYFAHNKHSTGGGYKDGLRAEDYVMNGPRLLSKGGIRVDDEPKIDNTGEIETNNNQQCISQSSEKIDTKERLPKPKSTTASTPITKYMWDDDDGSTNNNIAKIHIDTLPSFNTKTSFTKWADAGISKQNVEVRLIGENNEGLYASIVTNEGKNYHLHIPKMYGEADSVKCIVKKHKLLIKITKRKVPKQKYSKRHSNDEGMWKSATNILGKIAGNSNNNGDEEELVSVAWPRLSASSVAGGGLGGGKADIDEKLFKEMDVKKNGGDDFGDMKW